MPGKPEVSRTARPARGQLTPAGERRNLARAACEHAAAHQATPAEAISFRDAYLAAWDRDPTTTIGAAWEVWAQLHTPPQPHPPSCRQRRLYHLP